MRLLYLSKSKDEPGVGRVLGNDNDFELIVALLLAAASDHREDHQDCQQQCQQLFHNFASINFCFVFIHAYFALNTHRKETTLSSQENVTDIHNASKLIVYFNSITSFSKISNGYFG